MLEYRTLEDKPFVDVGDLSGRKGRMRDLLTRTWTMDVEEKLDNPTIVNEYYVARPDLIALAVLGNDKYGDVICKYNGISNPFEMNENDILIMPEQGVVYSGFENADLNASEFIEDEEENIMQKRASTIRKKTEYYSPSSAVVGDNPAFIIDKTHGLVFY